MSIFNKETYVGGVSTSQDSLDFGRDENSKIQIPLLFFPEHITYSNEVQNHQDGNSPPISPSHNEYK